jgi:hypothetical protein
MSFVEEKQVVEALSVHRLHPSPRNRVRPGCPEWRSHLPNAETPQASIESRAIEIAVAIDPKRSTPLFAGYPLCRRKWRNSNVQNFPLHLPDYKRHRASETGLFGRRINRTPICSIHGASRIFANPWPSTVSRIHILRDSRRRTRKHQSREFGLDPLLTPKPIFFGHPSDECLKFVGNRATTTPSRLPT